MSLELEVYKAFKEQIIGNHRPVHYNTNAADAIAKPITKSVDANSKGTTIDCCVATSMQCLEHMLALVAYMTVLEHCKIMHSC